MHNGKAQYKVTSHTVEKSTREQELNHLAQWTFDSIASYSDVRVFIEDGVIGNNRAYSIALAQTAGAVLSKLHCLHTPGIFMVNNKTWKKEVLGNGNASKEIVRQWLDKTYPMYAASCDGDQDRYDATCVALYGCGVLERAKRLAAIR